MFKRIYKEAHPASVALVEVGLSVYHINNWGAVMLATITFPPHAGVVAPASGEMDVTKIHNSLECECSWLSKLIERDSGRR